MRSSKNVLRFIWLFSGIGLILALAVFFDQAKGKAVLKGIQRIKKGQTDSVPLSNRVTRILTRNDTRSETIFREIMKTKGWEFICYYGRSALYRSQHQEVLARRTSLVGGFCIYELMDESYFKYMKSQIREVA